MDISEGRAAYAVKKELGLSETSRLSASSHDRRHLYNLVEFVAKNTLSKKYFNIPTLARFPCKLLSSGSVMRNAAQTAVFV